MRSQPDYNNTCYLDRSRNSYGEGWPSRERSDCIFNGDRWMRHSVQNASDSPQVHIVFVC